LADYGINLQQAALKQLHAMTKIQLFAQIWVCTASFHLLL